MSGPVVAAPRPAGPTQAQVAQVRAFNRFYTNVIGVLHDMYLDTPYTLTESRVLFEIARLGTVEVSWLRQALDIDPGYLSRVLGRFESDGLVTRHRSAADARRQEIRATEAGNAAVAELDARAVSQIGALLRGVDCDPVLDAMRVITQALGTVPDFGPTGDVAPRATLRPLELGDWYGDEWFVNEGLRGGEMAVVDGGIKIQPGATLKVVEPAVQLGTK